jgi:hypothetical protein
LLLFIPSRHALHLDDKECARGDPRKIEVRLPGLVGPRIEPVVYDKIRQLILRLLVSPQTSLNERRIHLSRVALGDGYLLVLAT